MIDTIPSHCLFVVVTIRTVTSAELSDKCTQRTGPPRTCFVTRLQQPIVTRERGFLSDIILIKCVAPPNS